MVEEEQDLQWQFLDHVVLHAHLPDFVGKKATDLQLLSACLRIYLWYKIEMRTKTQAVAAAAAGAAHTHTWESEDLKSLLTCQCDTWNGDPITKSKFIGVQAIINPCANSDHPRTERSNRLEIRTSISSSLDNKHIGLHSIEQCQIQDVQEGAGFTIWWTVGSQWKTEYINPINNSLPDFMMPQYDLSKVIINH